MLRLLSILVLLVFAVGCECSGGTQICDCCGTMVEWPSDESCSSGACDPYCVVGDAGPRDGGSEDAAADAGPDAGALDASADDAGVPEDSGPPGDAGPPACPATVPSDGESCTRAALCGYIDCADFGVARARCDGSSFTVTTFDCGPVDCRGTTCAAGQYCVVDVGGAVVPLCVDATAGPLTCETVCGGPCLDFPVTSDPPERFVCDVCTDPPCA